MGYVCELSVALSLGCGIVLLLSHLAQYDDTNHTGGYLESAAEVPSPEQLSLGRFVKGGVATDQEECNTIGASMLARGGSVVDALIAAELCIGIKSPMYAGIGGGFIMTVYDKPRSGGPRSIQTLNAREVAPLAATHEMFMRKETSSLQGGAAIAVPGDVAGLYEAWLQYGRLPWKQLVQPSIHMARYGSRVSGLLEEIIYNGTELIRRYGVQLDSMDNYPNLKAQYHHDDGRGYVEGETIIMEKLADTLQIIADEGAEAFYTGSLSKDIVKDIQEAGGIITADDLSMYRPVWKAPVSSTLKNGDFTIHGPPPPASTAVIQFIMNILDGYNFSREAEEADPGLLWHRYVEALKFGYGKRSALGDEDFVDVAEMLLNLTSSEYGAMYRARINDSGVLEALSQYEPDFLVQDSPGSHTAQLTAIGDDGSAAVITATLNGFFGSFVLGSRTGIIFNNQMDDFSTPEIVSMCGYSPSASNLIAPGKRPMSTMSPSIVLDKEGKLRMAVGAAGGSLIISHIAKMMVEHLWLDEPLHRAVAAPRLHHPLMPDILLVEANVPQDLLSSLQARGHNVSILHNHYYFSEGGAVADTCNKCACADGSCALCDLHCLHASSDWRNHVFDKVPKAAQPDGF